MRISHGNSSQYEFFRDAAKKLWAEAFGLDREEADAAPCLRRGPELEGA